MTFPLPDMQPYYKSKPTRYVSHLLGHEGPGSILSLLKTRGWSNSLLAGPLSGAKGFMFFIITVDLSEEGLEHTEEIATIVFQYLSMLRNTEPQEWIFKECSDLNAIEFRFQDQRSPIRTASHLANLLHEFPLKEVLSGPHLMEKFEPDLIEFLLSCLTPQHVRTQTVSKHFEGHTDRIEPWYGTLYSQEKIPPEIIQKWIDVEPIPELHLPPFNEFIPVDFNLYPSEPERSSLPVLIKDTPLCKLWYKQDDTFFMPKACLYFNITSPLAYEDPVQCAMTHLYVELVKDSLNEYAYAAEISGIEYKLEQTEYGMELRLKGYNDKQCVLLSKLLQKATNFQVDRHRFPEIKDIYLRSLKNFKAEAPHRHALYHMTRLLVEKDWSKEELAACVDGITADKVQGFVPHLLSHLHFECLFHGNLSKDMALKIAEMTERAFTESAGTKPLLPAQLAHYREVDLPDRSFYVFQEHNDVHPSSSIEIYYQVGEPTICTSPCQYISKLYRQTFSPHVQTCCWSCSLILSRNSASMCYELKSN
jgi:insulysin